MTHLGLGSSFEEPWLDLPGGMWVGLPSQEVALASWEGCVGLCLGVPITLPACTGGLWPCPARADLGDWGELFLSLCIWREVAWEELTSSEGNCTAPRRELLPSPGGRWAIARLGRLPDAWILGELLPSKEGWTVAGGELLPSLGGRWAMARVGWLPIAWLVGWLPITWLLAWGRPVPSRRRCQLLGENCLLSQEEGEQWPGRGCGDLPGKWYD